MTPRTKKTAAKRTLAAPKAPGAGHSGDSAEQTLLRILEAASQGKSVQELFGELGDLEHSDLVRQMDESSRTEAQDEAQDLAWDALEAMDDEESLALCERALAIDPDCVDALVQRANLTAKTTKEMIQALEEAVAAGERSLGQAFIKANTGHFWGLIETRPYMRARKDLADRLSERSPRKAIVHFEALLTLNPNDNQGARYLVLALYLRQNDLKGAASILERYPNDIDLSFRWGRVLERFLAGDKPGASAALLSARRANPYFEHYLSMRLPMPRQLPASYRLGSRDEAISCMAVLLPAWAAHTQAMFWVRDQLQTAVPGQRQKPMKKLKSK